MKTALLRTSIAFALIGASSILFVVMYRAEIAHNTPPVIQEAQAAVLPSEPPAYDPQALTWSEATSSAEWQARDSAASFTFNDKLWIMGGLNGDHAVENDHRTVSYWKAPHFNDIWASDDGIHWSLMKEHAAWAPRRSMSVLHFNGSLWMFGGWSPITQYTQDVWKSDDGITWEKVTSKAAWPAREGQSAEVFQGKMWLFGGVNYAERKTFNDVWWTDNGTEWHEATVHAPWSTRWDHATTVFKDKLYLVAGMAFKGKIFKDVWSSSDGVHWDLVTAEPPWVSRQGLSLVVFHDRMWIIGRLNDVDDGSGANDVWSSDDGVGWLKTNIDPPWSGREDHAGLLFKDRLYVFSGMDATLHWRNDVWYSSL